MPYVADPRGGATRDYYSVPKTAVDDPTQFDPTNATTSNDTTVNQYKAYTDSLLYAVLFYACFKFLSKLKERI